MTKGSAGRVARRNCLVPIQFRGYSTECSSGRRRDCWDRCWAFWDACCRSPTTRPCVDDSAICPLDLGVNRSEEPRHVLVDSTGLKVFGEGEWKVRQHGVGKRRTWRKLHLAVYAKTREIVAMALTESKRGDCQVLPSLLLQIEGKLSKVGADGAYDTWECRYAIIQHEAQAVIPPGADAVLNGNDQIEKVRQRDQAIREIKENGLKAWKQNSAYHQRSLAETTMFRMKTTFGGELQSRVIQNQIAEAVLKSHILNRFIQEGLPQSVKLQD